MTGAIAGRIVLFMKTKTAARAIEVTKRETWGNNVRVTLSSDYTVVVPPSHPLASTQDSLGGGK